MLILADESELPGGAGMQSFDAYYVAVVEVLQAIDEDAALALLGIRAEASLITLLEGETTASEALSYAKMMFEIGMDEVAHDVVRSVMGAKVGTPSASWSGAELHAIA